MAFDSNNDSQAPPDSGEPGGPGAVSPSTEAAAQDGPSVPPALARFRSCRWQQPPDAGSAEFCTHREVKPYAGTTGFDADAWCPDCVHYKLRRSPKKRSPNQDWND